MQILAIKFHYIGSITNREWHFYPVRARLGWAMLFRLNFAYDRVALITAEVLRETLICWTKLVDRLSVELNESQSNRQF